MSKQFLFGPVTCEFGRHLQKQRASGICRVFAPEPGTDVQAAHHEAWEDIVNKFTDGWRPDMLVLQLRQNTIPPALWLSPVSIVAVAEKPHLQWHSRRKMLALCDLVLTDLAGVEALQTVGMAHVWQSALGDLQLWQQQLERIERDWPAMLERAARRRERAGSPDLLSAAWEAVGTPGGPDPALARRLAAAEVERPRDAALGNARGVVALSTGARPGALVTAAHAFQDAWSADPRHAVAGLNLAETLAALHQRGNAADQAQGVLEVLDEIEVLPAVALDDLLFPNGAGLLHAEWERAAWENAGDCAAEARAKTDLVRLRLHTLLGEVTGDAHHFYAACVQRPDSPAIRASLGVALARQNRAVEAVPHLERALRGNPFDTATARVLHDTFVRIGQPARQQALARARRLLNAAAPDRVPLEAWFAETPPPVLDTARMAPPLRIVWQGAQEAIHSLALVNRGLCAALLERGHELSLVPQSGYEPADKSIALPGALAACKRASLAGPADIHVTHQWPPDLTPPSAGRWVVIQPWEFGSIPKAWVAPLRDRVDELWVPSNFVRQCYIQGGVPEAKVQVVPNGVGEVFFREDIEAYPLQTRKRFKFLFVGGTLPRKGFDLLLKAYRLVFSAADDVCLVVKDMGVGTFHRGQNATAMIEQLRATPAAPEVEYIADDLTEEQMAGLYRACDCVVQPYRGEGFCLPVAEAMACARPVIVTGFGPSLDYCTDETAYLLPYQIERMTEKRIGDLETVDYPFHAQPSKDELRRLLRHVVENPDEARARGARARDHVRARLTWAHAAAVAERRLAALGDAPAGRRPKTTLMMIVRNEEKNLRDCLASVAGLFDEIVITDTGSTDRTVAIALEFGARVQHFTWIDNFAAARNVSLQHATGEWLFWLDADDRVDDENREKLRRLLADLPTENIAYVINCRCMAEHDTGNETVVKHVRLFRNHPGMKWEHRIHEQILPSLRRTGVTTCFSDVVVNHVGYQDPALRGRKLERDLRILQLEYGELPNHPFTLFNLANTYRQTNDTAQALDLYRKSLAGSAPTDSIVSQLYSTIAQCERHLGRAAEALATCRLGRTYDPDDAEIMFTESLALHDLGDLTGAIAMLERLIGGSEAERFTSRASGLRGFKARHNLASYYKQAGRLDDAVAQWRLALAEQPGFLPPIFALGDVAVTRQDWPALDDVMARLRALPNVAPEAEVFRARAHHTRGEFAAALVILDLMLKANPRLLSACLIRSKVLVDEGRDWLAAEQALRAVLVIAPQHAEARKNLDLVLLRRQAG